MPERQIIVRPVGLVTQPNKLGVFPDGACSQARDMIMRNPAIMQQAYAKTPNWSSALYRPRLLYSTANQLLMLQRSAGGAMVLEWWNPFVGAPVIDGATIPYTSDNFSQTGRLFGLTMRGRTIINAETKDPIVADYEDPTSTAERTFRVCGLPQLMMAFAGPSAGSSPQAVLANTIVTYSVIAKRTMADGYVVVSRPSAALRYWQSVDVDPSIVCYWQAASPGLQAGDVVELYRSQSLSYASGGDVDPGSTLYLVKTATVTSTDVSNQYIILEDRAIASAAGGPLGGLGRALYTNPDLGGPAVTSNDPPPVAACTAQFRGRAWYANCRFPAEFKFAIRRGVGFLSTANERENGVGYRSVGGTFTNGSNVVTAISAAHMVGLAPGQSCGTSHGTFTITSVGTTTITLSGPSVGSGTETFSCYDQIEIDGVSKAVYSAFLVATGALTSKYRVTSTRTLFDAFASVREYTIRPQRYVPPATMTIRASQGDKYDPPLPLLSQTALTVQPTQLKNYVMYSHDQNPEAVPPANELWVGNGEIYAMVPTRDALWFFCSDGLFRLSGTIDRIEGIPDIRLDPIDGKLVLAGPRAWCVLHDKVYAYTNRGLVEISNDGIRELTTGVIGDLLPGQLWAASETPYLIADARVDEIYIMGAHATLNFIYASRYNCFTTTAQFDGSTVGVQIASTLALVFGYANTNIDELQPDLTALLTSSAILDLQPVFCGRPDTIKQFIDVMYIMETGSSGNLTARFNAGAYVSAEFLTVLANDMRATVGVPRDAPAIGPSLGVGFAVQSSGTKALSGISIRYATLTEQGGAR